MSVLVMRIYLREGRKCDPFDSSSREIEVMNPSDPEFPEKTTPPSGLPVTPAQWVDQYGDDLYRYALARVGQPEAAEDVVQDTPLAASKGVGRFDRRSSEKTWLLLPDGAQSPN
jgi:hypothetical protein